MQYDPKKDKLVQINKSKALFDNLKLYTGYSEVQLEADLADKERVLKYLVELNISSVDGVGRVIAEYYTDKENLMKYIAHKKVLPS
ncbi:hypothetical protein H8D36_01900 [archaeon]|nr:hypothetical protein [archaeon]MBL7057540.1 hypothetical protein [Candidatus Woesearchaeota archaeon]